RARAGLLPAHGLHAARPRPDAAAAQPRPLLRRRDPRAHRVHRLARPGPADPHAAPGARQRRGGPAPVHRALRRLSPGRPRGRPPRLERDERIVPAGEPSPRAEFAVLALLGLATLCAVGFVVVYAFNHLAHQTQYLGLSLGLALAFLAAACVVVSKRLVVEEQIEEDYPPPAHPEEIEEIERIVEESDSRFTRKRLLVLGA